MDGASFAQGIGAMMVTLIIAAALIGALVGAGIVGLAFWLL